MMKFRAILGILALALVVSSGTFGDDKKDPPKAKGYLPMYWKQLGLTDAQRQKVYDVQAKYKEKMADLEKQLKQLKSQERDELFEVLSREQKDQLKKIYDEKGPPDSPKDGAKKDDAPSKDSEKDSEKDK